jgi:DNA-binding NtrC family response regulator
VRELENAIERAVVLSRGAPIMVDHFPLTDASALTASRAQRRRSVDQRDDGTAAEDAGAAAGAAAGRAAGAAAGRAAGRGKARDGDADGNGAAVDGNGAGATFKEAVESLEKRLIADALDRHGGNRSKAAEELGIYRRLLYAKIREYGLGE